MKSIRQEKVEKLLIRDLGSIFQTKSREITPGIMVTVTDVRISKDLGYAAVYVSLFPTEDRSKAIESIQNHKGEIRYELGGLIGKQMRKVPELNFYLDDSFDKAQRIEELLKK